MRIEIEIKTKKEVDFKTIIVHAKVRYWEDAIVNDVPDQNGDLIPCRIGDDWKPIIDIDKGIIINWTDGINAKIHYKVCDCCGWELLDEDGNIVLNSEDGYVPSTLCPKEEGYGDYIIMDVDAHGNIDNWAFDIDDFIIYD